MIRHQIQNTILLEDFLSVHKKSEGSNEIEIESEVDAYVLSCAQSLIPINQSIEKIDLSIELLGNFNVSYESKYNPAEHIEFHVENCFIRVVGIYDRCLILVNSVLNLGIDISRVTHDIIVSNMNVKKYNLHELLKKIKRECKKYNDTRNKIIHHNSYKEDAFMTITAIHKTQQLSMENGDNLPFSKKVVNHFTEHFVNTKLQEFKDFVAAITPLIEDLYTKILPIYHDFKSQMYKVP